MAADEVERCAEAKAFLAIHDAFTRGDLDALRAAVDDPGLIPNGRVSEPIGSCLVYAVEGMRVGGTWRLEIAPHLAYGDRGVPDVIPPGPLLNAEIGILEDVPP
jgi:hypothetical protein